MSIIIKNEKPALIALACSLSLTNCSAQSASFDASSYFTGKSYANGIIGISVAESSQPLFSRSERQSVSPASTLKLITTGAAWAKLGGDHKSKTRLAIDEAQIIDGSLDGSVYIIGGGDPTLGSDRVKDSLTSSALLARWSKAVAEAGIKEIEGDIVGDSTASNELSIPGGWNWSDIGNYYGAGPQSLNYYDNLYHLRMLPGAKLDDPVSIIGTLPATIVEWTNELSTAGPNTGDRAYIFCGPLSNQALVRGTIPQGPEFSIRGSLPNPPQTAAEELYNYLKSQGIIIAGKPQTGAAPAKQKTIDTLPSPPLKNIVRIIHERSFNLYAESILLQCGDTTSSQVRASALSYESDFLAGMGVDIQGFSIQDGSGLSSGNKITARGMTEYLHAMRSKPFYDEWRKTINIYGNGDAESRKVLNTISGAVQAKTGSIGGVRGFCGYLKTKAGKELEFAIVLQDYDGGGVDAEIDRFLKDLHTAY